METKRLALLEILNQVKPGLANKEILEQTTCFAFDGKRVVTYNDEIAISHPCVLGIEGAVKAKELYALLNKLKDETIDISSSESELLVKGGRSKAGIRLEAEVTLPLDEIKEPKKWNKLPADFAASVDFCHFSAGKDMAKPLLTCIHVFGDTVESCDNFRLTRKTMAGKIKDALLLPSEAAKTLCDYAPTEYGETDGWAHFRNDAGTSFSLRTYEGQYPDIGKYMEVDNPNEIKMPADLGEILERAGVFSDSDFDHDEKVTISLSGKEMTIRGEGAAGWFEESCPVRWRGAKDISFGVHPDFLHQMLDHIKTVEVSPEQGRLRIAGDDFTHIIILEAE